MILNNQHTRTIELKVPVCLFDQKPEHDITIPTDIVIGLNGKRKDLQTLDVQSLAVHINAQKLCHGEHALIVDSSTLFLPSSVKLVHYMPSNNVIQVIDNSRDAEAKNATDGNLSHNASLVTLLNSETTQNKTGQTHSA
jgi:hypothetical protein